MEPVNYLNAALSAEVGYCVKSTEPQKLRTKLYAARREQQRNGIHAFDELSFFEMPDGESIWIVKHEALREYRNGGTETSEV